jgi:hypothetical protein
LLAVWQTGRVLGGHQTVLIATNPMIAVGLVEDARCETSLKAVG